MDNLDPRAIARDYTTGVAAGKIDPDKVQKVVDAINEGRKFTYTPTSAAEEKFIQKLLVAKDFNDIYATPDEELAEEFITEEAGKVANPFEGGSIRKTFKAVDEFSDKIPDKIKKKRIKKARKVADIFSNEK
jgi:hypothetical protein